jgi:tetratricopeptide (TPR) repeat protein
MLACMNGRSLGPFQLVERIGMGGMGEVWRASHASQGVPVAVKILSPTAAKDEEFVRAFKNEVRAVAALHHPHIVTVLDYGQVPDGPSAGAPYLVMELVDSGSLATRRGRLQWPELRTVLLALLDALAHAHARGLVHRDLKAQNVLVSSDRGVVLTDFGLAHLLDRAQDLTHVRGGTPAYMSPEQIEGRWRDFGPWTDLYAFGCLATALATGQGPFGKRPAAETLMAHLREEPRPLVPTTPVPRGFESWVRTLLAKEPERRFRRAADAAWALLQLREPEGRRAAPRRVDPEEPTRIEADTNPIAFRHALGNTLPPWSPQEDAGRIPPMAADWRRAELHDNAPDLRGVGLGLYGLRAIPLAGREAERDRIWAALRRVHATREPAAVLLHGPAGTGKSRLAHSMAARAHEVGAASVLGAGHGPWSAPMDGLVAMATAALGCGGLDHDAVQQRVGAHLASHGADDPLERSALVDLLSDRGPGKESRADAKRNERLALITRLLGRFAAERPLMVVLDDVQWSADAIDLVAAALSRPSSEPFPVLFVLTAQDEALAETRREGYRLLALQAVPGVDRVEIGPLTGRAWKDLVRTLLGLSGDLARKVEARAGGNPLFAVHLVGDWVQRGLLRPGPKGFELAPGAHVDLPDALHDVWSRRVEQVLDGLAPAAGEALEIASALGPTVNDAEWRVACGLAGVEAPEGLGDRLISRRLARAEPAGWSFVHGMLRESVDRRARTGGRTERWHRACASVVEEARARGRRGLGMRLARHLAEAGDIGAALTPMLEAATDARDTDAYDLAHAVLDEREGLLRRGQIGRDDPRWGEGQALRADVLRLEGRYAEAWDLARATEADARRFGWDEVLPEALAVQGHVARQQGDLKDSERLISRARALYERLGRPRGIATATNTLGIVMKRLGRLDEAWALQMQAKAIFTGLGDRFGVASCIREQADVALQRGDLDTAEGLCLVAMRHFTELGGRGGAAYLHNSLGQIAVLRKDLDGAVAEYEKARQMYDEIGSPQAAIPAANLGSIHAQRGEWAPARSRLSEAIRRYESLGWSSYAAAARAELLNVLARTADWTTWDVTMTALGIGGDRVPADRESLDALASASEAARQAGHADRARVAWGLAADVARRSGNAELAAAFPPRVD